MRRLFILVLVLLALSGTALWAQTELRGIVVQSDDGSRVSGAMLFLIDAETKQSLATSQSDDDGQFLFNCRTSLKEGQSLIVRGSLLGYKAYKKAHYFHKGQELKIVMEATSYQLKEVKIHAPAIREEGDTIIYRTSAFAQKQDMTLSQVIERMPGLEVVGGGQIRFEGKAINKFYIEQMDLLGRRYSIASNSLRPDDVAAVEVYRQHEPIRMLSEHSLSDRAALNIRLTERAKGRWLAWLSAGVGAAPLLYDLNARAMRFNATTQGIYLAKANDTGKDMSAELREQELSMSRKLSFSLSQFASLDFYQSMGEVIKDSPVGKRARANHSYALSGNQLVKLGQHQFLRLSATYLDEQLASSRGETIEYTMPNGEVKHLSSDQQYQLHERSMVLSGEYEHNGDRSFLLNKSKIEHQSKRSNDLLRQDMKDYSQELSLPYLRVENSTEWLFRVGGTLVKLDNVAKYLSRHHSMEISLPLLQSVASQLFDNSLMLGINWRWGAHQLDNNFQWDIQQHRIGVESSWLPNQGTPPSDYLSSSLTWQPEYNWKEHGWHVKLQLPISYFYFRYPESREGFVKSDPLISVSKFWDNNFKINGSYQLIHNIVGAAKQFPGLKLRDSRQLSEQLPRPYQGYGHFARLGLSYTVPMTGTSIIGGVHFSESQRRYTSSTGLKEGYIIYRQIEKPSTSSRVGGNLRLSQTFWKANLDVALQGSYDRTWSELYLQQQMLALLSDSYVGRLEMHYRPIPDLTIDYEGSFIGNVANEDGGRLEHLPKLLQQRHKGSLLFWLAENWSATLSAEYHHTSERNSKSYAEATFLDFALKYDTKRFGAELTLSNITNQKAYEVITIKEPHTFLAVTPLRPFEVLLRVKFSL